jgi:flagellar hook-associated protein 2
MGIQVNGPASGIQTDLLIQQLLSVERRPQVVMNRQLQMMQWKKSAWNEINTKLLALKTTVEGLLQRDKLLASKVSSTKEELVSATGSGIATSGEYEIIVHALATSTKLVSGAGKAGFGLGKAISQFSPFTEGSNFGTRISKGTFTINGVQIEIQEGDYLGDGTGTDGHDLIQKINDSAAGVIASYDAVTDRIAIKAKEPGGNVHLGAVSDTSNFLTATYLLTAPEKEIDGVKVKTSTSHLGHINTRELLKDANFAEELLDSDGGTTGQGKFKINGVEITYDLSRDNIDNIITRINNSAAGVTAFHDRMTDRIIFQNKATGSFNIVLEDLEGNFVQALDLGAGAAITMGQNAKLSIAGFNNDQPIYSNSNQVTGVVPGLTINLKATTTEPVKLNVEQDEEIIKNAITDFVNKYNETVKHLSSKLREKSVTDKEWEQMTDSERRAGLMSGNSTLGKIRFDLLEQIIDPISDPDGVFKLLSQIGIESVVDAGGSNSGTLKIDDKKLEEAIRNNPEGIARLFFNDADGDGVIDRDENKKPIESGIAVRLLDYLDSLLDTRVYEHGKGGMVPRQQDELDVSIKYMQNRIQDFDRRIEQREEYLVRQFTAMEKALAVLQSQSTWLSGQIAGLFG